MLNKPLFGCEKFKLLKVIGEKTVQVVNSIEEDLELLGHKDKVIDIIDIKIKLGEVSDFVFKDKVVKQGNLVLQILFCEDDNDVECVFVKVPFEAVAEIPGVDPKLELDIQNKLVSAEADFELDKGAVIIKVAADILIKVSTFVQRKLKVCNTSVISHKQVK